MRKNYNFAGRILSGYPAAAKIAPRIQLEVYDLLLYGKVLVYKYMKTGTGSTYDVKIRN